MTVSEVELVTLDQLVQDGVIDPDQVGMLWIDVEGHEGHVLGGAETLTERGVPVVFEFDPEILDLRGDMEAIRRVADGAYTHYVDLRRRETDPSASRFQLHPVCDLSQLTARLTDPSTSATYTDLMLLRLDSEQARADLPDLMTQR